MLRFRAKFLSCFYCGKRSDTYFDRASPAKPQQFDCKYCNATNHLDKNGEITNPPVAKVNAGSPTIPQYAPKHNTLASPPPVDPDSIFCDACLKHQRLFVASMAQYEGGDNQEDFDLDKDYYRYRRNLVNRYPQCCDQCKPKVEDAIKKADYTAKTDYMRRMVEKSRDPRNWSKKNSGREYVHSLGRMGWYLGLLLQLIWHSKALAGIATTSASGMKDPDDASWTMKGLQLINDGVGYLPEDSNLIYWSLIASVVSIWWNPKFIQILRGFDRHLLGISQWYFVQVLLVAMRFGLVYLQIDEKSKSAQLAAHILTAAMAIFITSRATRIIKTDTTPLFGEHKNGPPTPNPAQATSEGFTFWKQTKQKKPTMAEALNEALPRPGEPGYIDSNDSIQTNYDYQFIAAPKRAPHFPQQEEDAMEWQPTGSTTLPRALRNPNIGSGNRPFGQAPVQENSRPFWYGAPKAPTNPASEAANGPRQPVFWGSQREQPQPGFGGAPRNNLEFQQPKFFAQPTKPDREHDEQLAGLAGGLSFDEGKAKQGGWFGFGK